MMNFMHKHKFVVVERSNILQLDDMGYQLRLVICKCKKCNEQKQIWIDVPEKEFKELETGESVLITWK